MRRFSSKVFFPVLILVLIFVLTGCKKSSDNTPKYSGIEGYWRVTKIGDQTFPYDVFADFEVPDLDYSLLIDQYFSLIKGKMRMYFRVTYKNFSAAELKIMYDNMEEEYGFVIKNGECFYIADTDSSYTISDEKIIIDDGYEEYTAIYVIDGKTLVIFDEENNSEMHLRRVSSSAVAGAKEVPINIFEEENF